MKIASILIAALVLSMSVSANAGVDGKSDHPLTLEIPLDAFDTPSADSPSKEEKGSGVLRELLDMPVKVNKVDMRCQQECTNMGHSADSCEKRCAY